MPPQVPWTRIFPDTNHRWIMGLRQGDLTRFFADRDPTGSVRAQRERWILDTPEKYTAILPAAYAALVESCDLARSWGLPVGTEGPLKHERLRELGMAWEPDVVWMHPGEDGRYVLAGGVVCFPSSWSLPEMLGRPMPEVHALVPGLNAVLARQIDTFLDKLEPGVAWQRENWGLSRDSELNHHPSRPRASLDATITVDQVWIRLEHQLLLKLPRSGSVLFGIRLEVIPLTDLLADQPASQRFARLLSTMNATAAQYKGVADARSALLAMVNDACASA